MSRPNITLDQIFETQIQTLALTQRPHTVDNYRYVARRFLAYLHTTFPQVRRLVQLRRDPHLLGWFRWLCEQDPPLRNGTRTNQLLCLRRLLQDLAANGHPLPLDLIRRDDFPPPEQIPRFAALWLAFCSFTRWPHPRPGPNRKTGCCPGMSATVLCIRPSAER
jgi:hypothetical protein